MNIFLLWNKNVWNAALERGDITSKQYVRSATGTHLASSSEPPVVVATAVDTPPTGYVPVAEAVEQPGLTPLHTAAEFGREIAAESEQSASMALTGQGSAPALVTAKTVDEQFYDNEDRSTDEYHGEVTLPSTDEAAGGNLLVDAEGKSQTAGSDLNSQTEMDSELVAVEEEARAPQLIRSSKDAGTPDTIPAIGMQVLICYIPIPEVIPFDRAEVGMKVTVNIKKGRRYKGTISEKTDSTIKLQWNSRETGGPSPAFADANVFSKSRWEDGEGAEPKPQDEGWGDLNGLRGEIVGFTRAGHIAVHFSKLIHAVKLQGAHLAVVQTGTAAHSAQAVEMQKMQQTAGVHMARVTDEMNAYQSAESESATLHGCIEEAKTYPMAPVYNFGDEGESLVLLAQQYLTWAEPLVRNIRETDAHFEFALDAFDRFAVLEASDPVVAEASPKPKPDAMADPRHKEAAKELHKWVFALVEQTRVMYQAALRLREQDHEDSPADDTLLKCDQLMKIIWIEFFKNYY